MGGHWNWDEKDKKFAAYFNELGHLFYEAYSDSTTWLDAVRVSISGMLLMSKFMWRQGFISCPEICTADTPKMEV